jgi:hypothetical protein
MSFTNLEQLPFEGVSYEFHGEKQGAPICAYIVNAKLGQGPPLHMLGFDASSSGLGSASTAFDSRAVGRPEARFFLSGLGVG